MRFVFAIQVIGVLLLFQPDASLGCAKADWGTSFDRPGQWSVCPSNNAFLKGLERNTQDRGSFWNNYYNDDRLGRIERGKCCPATESDYANKPATCKDLDWTYSWKGSGSRRSAHCPDGYYLNGFKPTGKWLNDLNQVKCCRPENQPEEYEDCYMEDVSKSFDNIGLSECKREGYYMTGLEKTVNCKYILCIEGFKCCKMPKATACAGRLGMQNGLIRDDQITVSTNSAMTSTAKFARLNFNTREGGWVSGVNNRYQWLMVDLKRNTKITGIATQGRYNSDQYVTKYELTYKKDGANMGYAYPEVFDANSDGNTAVFHQLSTPIIARYIRFHPTAWHKHIAVRLELYGCLAQ